MAAPVEGTVVEIPIIYRVLYISGGSLGFLNHQLPHKEVVYHEKNIGINSIVIFSADDWGVLLHLLNAWCLGSITFLRFGEAASVGNVTCFL